MEITNGAKFGKYNARKNHLASQSNTEWQCLEETENPQNAVSLVKTASLN